jgi:hypothetical protein
MFERTATSRLPEAVIPEDLQQLHDTDRLMPELVFRILTFSISWA